ncbi:MAG: NF038122 family metalloprotease, partial [Betaproteobacteria bacterium]|nr:NF038122 family metalloprotease [Betaproteobacteria bacterium]
GALATGGADNSYTFNSYSDMVAALSKQGNGLGTNLPTTDPTGGSSWNVSMAEAEALGLSGATAASGSIGFSSDPSVSWSFDTSQGIGSTQYDFVSTALHEITHALGRINSASSGSYDPLNLYTYSAPGVLQLNQAAPAYFSVNGGTTNLNNFDMSSTGDPADWATTLTDSFGPGPTGIPGPMSATDWLVMESLGYHVKPTYILFGPTAVNAGGHDYLQLSTVNVASGTAVHYAISGLAANQLDSGSLTGTATVGSDGTALIDLGVQTGAPAANATVTLSDSSANTLTSYAVTVNSTANNTLVAVPGTGVATTSYGTNNNDTITGPVNGVVNYDGASTDYIITQPASNTLQVYDPTPGRDGTDTLVGVDRLHFTDTSVAFDLGATQSAGETAEILGAALGKSALSNAGFVGIGIKLFDAGQTLTDVATLVLNDNLVTTASPNAFVSAVWNNVVGATIDSQNLTTFSQMITSAANQASEEVQLLVLAAGTQANQTHIGLSGLAQHGIDYTPA